MTIAAIEPCQNRSHIQKSWVVSPPLILTLLTLATRLPLQGRMLYSWDSVNFAFALRHFDIAAGQPQAPGYLFYVLLGRLGLALTGSPESGLVFVSILGTVLATWALYDLGTRLWNPRVGWFAALLQLSSPVVWFYGEVALPNIGDAVLATIIAGLAWRVWRGETRLALALALCLGLAGGYREQTMVFLLPLAALACAQLPWRLAVTSLAVLVLASLSWLIPLLNSSGGWHAYWSTIGGYSRGFDDRTSVFLGAGWPGLSHNISKLLRYTLWAWAFGIVPLLAGGAALRYSRETPWRRNPRVWLMALWAVPCLFFYVFIHMGQQGLIFSYLPICFLLSARAGDAVARRWPGGRGLTAVCIAGNALVYLLAPTYFFGIKVLSAATVRDQDRLVANLTGIVKAELPAGGTLMADMWRYPEYYLPAVPLVAHRSGPGNIPLGGSAPDGTPQPPYRDAAALAWYEPGLDPLDRSPSQTTWLPMHNGMQMRVLRRSPNQHFWITSGGFGVAAGK